MKLFIWVKSADFEPIELEMKPSFEKNVHFVQLFVTYRESTLCFVAAMSTLDLVAESVSGKHLDRIEGNSQVLSYRDVWQYHEMLCLYDFPCALLYFPQG